ncbi:conserved hypothetical protein [Verrucomicrobiia bacterium DG1235]|nr:conserved hypothetical protein [Verrucomicrobiae bacterium DG1235]
MFLLSKNLSFDRSMKLISLAFAAFALLPFTLSNADTLTAESQIDTVSLFRDGARVTRIAQIDAPAGKSTIRFEGLPTTVDYSALEASIGDAKGVIRNAKIFHPENIKDNAEVEAIREKLEAHRREIRSVQQDKTIAKSRIKFVEDLAESFAKGYGELSDNGSSLSLEQGLSTWELVDKTKREAAEIEEAVDAKLRELAKTEEDIKIELREAQERDSLTRSIAEVEIDLDSAQSIQLAISYQALSARWQPQYELRAHPEDALLDFGYFANVWQQTGEDWTDVTLSLHTNQANRRGNVPELYPWRVNRQQDEEVYELSSFGMSEKRQRSALLQNSIAVADMAMAPPSEQQIAVTTSTVSFQVTLPGSVTVPSARENSTLPVTSAAFAAEFWSEVVPKVQLDTYLRARSVNELQIPILPGIALAFVDGKLSSKVNLEKTLPTEKLELSLGTDANIVVERIEGAQLDKDTGFLDKTVTLTRSYTNKVTNYHSIAHKVVLVDQFPISTDAKIEITRLSPKDSEIKVLEDKKDSGIFQWETTLASEEKREFKTSYQIVHPRDWNLGPNL